MIRHHQTIVMICILWQIPPGDLPTDSDVPDFNTNPYEFIVRVKKSSSFG